jgi:hypothetical protein
MHQIWLVRVYVSKVNIDLFGGREKILLLLLKHFLLKGVGINSKKNMKLFWMSAKLDLDEYESKACRRYLMEENVLSLYVFVRLHIIIKRYLCMLSGGN